MNILVVNDDSISAPGIHLLAKTAAAFGKVWVVAPAEQCSGMSHRITPGGTLRIKKVEDFPVPVESAYKVYGTPADCVKVALTYLLPKKPDFVFSGINNGFNVGCEIAYSGTAGAAMEALINGIPAIAFSSAYGRPMTLAEKYIIPIVNELIEKEQNPKEIWNVNFPAVEGNIPKGILYDHTIADVCLYSAEYQITTHTDGSISLDIIGLPLEDANAAPEGTDVAAVLDGYISIGKVRCSVL